MKNLFLRVPHINNKVTRVKKSSFSSLCFSGSREDATGKGLSSRVSTFRPNLLPGLYLRNSNPSSALRRVVAFLPLISFFSLYFSLFLSLRRKHERTASSLGRARIHADTHYWSIFQYCVTELGKTFRKRSFERERSTMRLFI